MTTTNPLASLLQRYNTLQAQRATATSTPSGTAASTASATSTGGKSDSVSISDSALQALIVSEMQALAKGGSSDASTTGTMADAAPTTAQEALDQSRLFLMQAQQSFLNPDQQDTTGSGSGKANDMSSLMTLYAQGLDRQITQSIQAAKARMAEAGKTTTTSTPAPDKT